MSKRGIISKALGRIGSEHYKFAETNQDIAVRVHEILEEKGWTQQDLAEKMGKQDSEISKWLSGTHNFTLKTLTKLEACLEEELILSHQQAYERFSVFSTSFHQIKEEPVKWERTEEAELSEEEASKKEGTEPIVPAA